jgi:hypothetical protein
MKPGNGKEFSATELERVLFTNELVGLEVSDKNAKRPADELSSPSTESKRKRTRGKNESRDPDQKVQLNGKSTSDNRSSSPTVANSEDQQGLSSESAVSAADRAVGVPRVGIGVIVLNKHDEVLIGKRKSPHGQGNSGLTTSLTVGTWSLPGVYSICYYD